MFLINNRGAIHKLCRDKQGGGGIANCPCYYISLCSKLVYGGEGGQKSSKSRLLSLCMAPKNPFQPQNVEFLHLSFEIGPRFEIYHGKFSRKISMTTVQISPTVRTYLTYSSTSYDIKSFETRKISFSRFESFKKQRIVNFRKCLIRSGAF